MSSRSWSSLWSRDPALSGRSVLPSQGWRSTGTTSRAACVAGAAALGLVLAGRG